MLLNQPQLKIGQSCVNSACSPLQGPSPHYWIPTTVLNSTVRNTGETGDMYCYDTHLHIDQFLLFLTIVPPPPDKGLVVVTYVTKQLKYDILTF